MDEVVLTGGNMEPVVRVGDTVRRQTGAWTPAVHALLTLLENAGISGVPRVLGMDARGREILTFTEGVVLDDSPALWATSVLESAARLLRRIHDASVPLVSDVSLTWRSPRREPAEVICHNDFATYNLIACDDDLVGVIDFDFASPGSRLWDLAYLAYRIVPFAEDAPGAGTLERDVRLDLLVSAYGAAYSPDEVRAAAAERLDDLRAFTLARAEQTGRSDLLEHAAMYARDAATLRAAARGRPRT